MMIRSRSKKSTISIGWVDLGRKSCFTIRHTSLIQIILFFQTILNAAEFVVSIETQSVDANEEKDVNSTEKDFLYDNIEGNRNPFSIKMINKKVNDDRDGYIEKDLIEDGFFSSIAESDPSCAHDGIDDTNSDCWNPPSSTIQTEEVIIDEDIDTPSDVNDQAERKGKHKGKTSYVDKHWGSDRRIIEMRDELKNRGTSRSSDNKRDPHRNERPPIFLLPGLASTRLVSWKYKSCSNPLLSHVKVQDYVWMNINMLLQMATIDGKCFFECMTLGLNQTDMNDINVGCKLRPDEGLDAISSLAPGSFGSNLFVGGKNTVYAWLTQWLSDNLGYDVSSIVGLPYDWRLSPDIMEKRDGFLTLTRKRIEATVASNGMPGVMVAHSMGNSVFRYFLEWLRNEMHEEAYIRYVKQAKKRERMMRAQSNNGLHDNILLKILPGWMGGHPYSDYDLLAAEASIEGGQSFDMSYSYDNDFEHLFPSHFSNSEDKKMFTQANEYSAKEEELKSRRREGKHSKLWELAQIEGDIAWLEWLDAHIWAYVGLSAPLLGAMNSVRAVISGENMGLPMTEEDARKMELSFGSTHTINPISTRTGFCDDGFGPKGGIDKGANRANLACLDELVEGIERAGGVKDPWRDFPALKRILKDRVDWDTDFSPISIHEETCLVSEKPPCKLQSERHFGPKDVQTGNIFSEFSKLWKEKGDPLKIKQEQLVSSWWHSPFPNLLDSTWDRPHIKHIILAYGVDNPTEVGYVYRKSHSKDPTSDTVDSEGSTDQVSKEEDEYDGIPLLKTVIAEEPEGVLVEESKIPEPKSLTESVMMKKKSTRRFLNNGDGKGKLHHSGDGSVPYISLAWAHTWLLHATRAMRRTTFGNTKEGERISDDNALEKIVVSYRPKGGSQWRKGGKCENEENVTIGKNKNKHSDTGAKHPHGTKYKPEMFRFQSKGKSRSTGMEYTTAVIEAIGVEHKETTRNYDILAAVFTDVLKHMHDDLDLFDKA